MTSSPLLSTRRAFLGSAAATAASVTTLALPGVGMAVPAASIATPPQKVRFAAGDSFVVGNLYLPPGYRQDTRYPAVVVGGSLTSVKEMMAGTYAAEMANRGIMALAIDYRHYGESGGEPRQYENPPTKAEDLSAAVAYLASRRDVRPGGVGVLGICTSGGNALYAAARDRVIGAVVSVVGHFIEPSVAPSAPVYGGTETIERHRAEGRAARAKYERTGENTLILGYHPTDRRASHVAPGMEYYLDAKRGGVPQWKNAFAVMSWEPWLDFDPVREAPRVTAPTLIVHSDDSFMPDQARKVYGLLQGPKRLHWTTGNHFEFYDGSKVLEAADAAAEHFLKFLTVAPQGARNVHVVREFFERLHRKDIDGWAKLWAEHGRIIVFYPPEGFAPSIDGKAAISSAFRDLFRNFASFDTELTGVYPAADSDAVCVEYKVRATLVGGVEYRNENIVVFRFQDGLISAYHDYFDPRRFEAVVNALGRR
jgi:fermentation-respiration switch protein FrsA (DUF1100 family)